MRLRFRKGPHQIEPKRCGWAAVAPARLDSERFGKGVRRPAAGRLAAALLHHGLLQPVCHLRCACPPPLGQRCGQQAQRPAAQGLRSAGAARGSAALTQGLPQAQRQRRRKSAVAAAQCRRHAAVRTARRIAMRRNAWPVAPPTWGGRPPRPSSGWPKRARGPARSGSSLPGRPNPECPNPASAQAARSSAAKCCTRSTAAAGVSPLERHPVRSAGAAGQPALLGGSRLARGKRPLERWLAAAKRRRQRTAEQLQAQGNVELGKDEPRAVRQAHARRQEERLQPLGAARRGRRLPPFAACSRLEKRTADCLTHHASRACQQQTALSTLRVSEASRYELTARKPQTHALG